MGPERFELLQVRSEFDPVVDLYRAVQPARVLEIGCWDGGTLKTWLQEASPELVVALDLEHRNQAFYDSWAKPGTTVKVLTGDSLTHAMANAVREHAPYDWVMVDGDHSDPGVRSDVALVMPLIREGGTMLLHDITPPVGNHSYPPGVLLDELERQGHTVLRFEDPSRDPWSHGIGVVKL